MSNFEWIQFVFLYFNYLHSNFALLWNNKEEKKNKMGWKNAVYIVHGQSISNKKITNF